MKLLVACPECHRTYDATGMAPGTRFRCRCGQVVPVQVPQGHQAAVVRCSSCGGPRQQQEARCSYCGAAFTVHEQRLDAVCPHCLACVSGSAQFCHACGERLLVEETLGEPSEYGCPVCGPEAQLRSRRFGQQKVSALECPRCAGLWLSHEALDHLVKQAAKQAPAEAAGTAKPVGDLTAPQPGPRYRKCIVCQGIMPRKQYGRRSGVIVDVCGQHGVWFDFEELHKVLQWIRSGGTPQPLLAVPQKDQLEETDSDQGRTDRYGSSLADAVTVALWRFFG